MDTLGSIRQEIIEAQRSEAITGEQRFCYEYIEEIMIQGCYRVSGNKTDFKEPSTLAHFLFDFDDGRVRAHWEDRGYRKLYRRAVTGVKLAMGHERWGQSLSQKLFSQLFHTHWILPYPSNEVFLQTTKAGDRMWYSIVQRPVASGNGDVKQWKWGRKDWEAGRPPVRQPWISWTRREWEQWFAQQGATVEPVGI